MTVNYSTADEQTTADTAIPPTLKIPLPFPGAMEKRHPDTPRVNRFLRKFAALLHAHNVERAGEEEAAAPCPVDVAEPLPPLLEQNLRRAVETHLNAARQAEREGRLSDIKLYCLAFADALIEGAIASTEGAEDGQEAAAAEPTPATLQDVADWAERHDAHVVILSKSGTGGTVVLSPDEPTQGVEDTEGV